MREFRERCQEDYFVAVITACFRLLENFGADVLIGVLGRSITLEDIERDPSQYTPPGLSFGMP